MPASTLDERTALIVVDLQHGTVDGPSVVPTGPVVANAARLAAAFRAHDLPVVVATVRGGPPGRIGVLQGRPSPATDLGEVVPGLGTAPGDLHVTRTGWSAFAGTSLAGLLRERGVTQVVVVGMATGIGVESTARQAYDLGLHVTVVQDAVADRFAQGHERALGLVLPMLGEVATTDEVVALLDARAS
ncbi:cysteine hydrolase family protein [Cellulomonas oligotrophica]|uniref:Hydrolase n=1 Tax=Cellulomonas oligotrophica TaxID=931536 RepID=A0A7Y9FEV7_9CELL|nr:cysteine hydrolase [Cellulomonas oligotrophica]NYD85717.1 nicotinamidase-related amidase [Cellulomonas oligotrophica]GIG31275.1 hydrolase [Cellulomonas oligotrophica]